jgi:hypothetical protein
VNVLGAVQVTVAGREWPYLFSFLTNKLVIGPKGCGIKSLLLEKIESFWCFGGFY